MLGCLPFGLVGGVWLLWMLDYDSVSRSARASWRWLGLTAETGVIMLLFLKQATARFREAGLLKTREDLRRAVVEGATGRARPLLMTVASDVIGLLPILWSTGTGSEAMRRIAAPLVGGVLTATLVTLFVLPVVYAAIHGRTLPPGEEG